MNNGQFETLYIGRPRGRTSSEYIINIGTTDRTTHANLIPAGVKSWVQVELVLRGCRSFVRSATGGKMMILSVVLSISLPVNRDDTEISIRAKTRTNERYDETSERGRNCEDTANLNQMIFCVMREVGHMMNGSGLIGFLQILKGWKQATRTLKAVPGLARNASSRGHAKRYRHADGPYLCQLSEDYRLTLATDNKKGHSIARTR